jgi:hypothetical protein
VNLRAPLNGRELFPLVVKIRRRCAPPNNELERTPLSRLRPTQLATVRHLSLMATQTRIQRNNFFARHAPILLIVSLVWFALTLQHQPISLLYIFAWIVIGLLYGVVTIFGLRKRYSSFWGVVSLIILLGGGFLLSDVVGRGPSGWFGSSQGIALVFVCFCALNWALRCKPKTA